MKNISLKLRGLMFPLLVLCLSAGVAQSVTQTPSVPRTPGVIPTPAGSGPARSAAGPANLDYVDPTVGNVGWLLEPTRPTVQLPNQLIRFTPQRKDYMDDQISDFPLTIVSHRLGQVFSIKPSLGAAGPNASSDAGATGASNATGPSAAGASAVPADDAWDARMTYDHDLEVNKPWYYSTSLGDEGITVEFTAGKKVGYYRFHFPGGNVQRSILFGVYNDGPSDWHFISDKEVAGMETYHGDVKVYMYGVFNQPGATGVKGTRAYVSFPGSARDVAFKYAISYISPEQAKRNLDEETGHVTFEQLAAAGKAVWSRTMNQIRVEGGTVAQRRSFFTALYRCKERMVDITEDGQYYSGYDKQIHKDTRPFYVDDWSWDTHLALHPLRTILDPAQEEDMLQSYVRMYEQSGWMPTFPVLFGDNPCMNGFHSTISFVDAYAKGLKHFDVEKAYEGMRKNAISATMLPWENGDKTVLDDFYYAHGYFPALHPGERETIPEVNTFEKRQAVAVTLGNSHDDWALGQLAGALGKTEDSVLFTGRGQNYRNLWNPEKQFFLPKDDKGNWIFINPKFDGGQGGREYYDENNGWTYLWQVQQDIPGLIGLMGGKNAFAERLDQLFREGLDMSKSAFWYKFPDCTGLVGQFSMGNEPSFHIPYLYDYAGEAWKTQKRVRFLLDVWFKDNIFGIPGDEDGGGMSAFVVFSSMGFYPVTPGVPVYAIGSPVFSKVSIALPNGKTFRLIADHCSVVNKYIQSATFDGKPLNRPWFTHQQLVNGGRLELVMGPKPNKDWGNGTQP